MHSDAWIYKSRNRCDAATRGPWAAWVAHDADGTRLYGVSIEDDPEVDIVGATRTDTDNLEFIAAARTDLPKALDALEAVLQLADAWDALGGAGGIRDPREHAESLRTVIHIALNKRKPK